jgi:hypothetical protein
MKMEQTWCSETSVHTIKTLGNHPKEGVQHSQHGESLKSRMLKFAIRLHFPATQIFSLAQCSHIIHLYVTCLALLIAIYVSEAKLILVKLRYY